MSKDFKNFIQIEKGYLAATHSYTALASFTTPVSVGATWKIIGFTFALTKSLNLNLLSAHEKMSRHSLGSLEQPHESPGFVAPEVAINMILKTEEESD